MHLDCFTTFAMMGEGVGGLYMGGSLGVEGCWYMQIYKVTGVDGSRVGVVAA
jgi:hypothetical protein